MRLAARHMLWGVRIRRRPVNVMVDIMQFIIDALIVIGLLTILVLVIIKIFESI